MATMTLLQMVQNILSAMDSDDVSNITDTVESAQVAEVIKETYYQMIENRVIPELRELLPLTALADSDFPNYLKYPNGVAQIAWVKYNVKTAAADRDEFVDIPFLTPDNFVERIYSRNSTDSNVTSITDKASVPLLIVTDKRPEFWTTFDDLHLVFDSYDSGIDSTLQASKSVAWGQTSPGWTSDNTFVPDLDDSLFPMFLAEAKGTCFLNFKQIRNRQAEQTARDQKVRMQGDKHRNQQGDSRPDFGRRGSKPRVRSNRFNFNGT